MDKYPYLSAKEADLLETSYKVEDTTWTWDGLKFLNENTEGEDPHPYVAQCKYLGDTLICMADTYENGGWDALFIQKANADQIQKTLKKLNAAMEIVQKVKYIASVNIDGGEISPFHIADLCRLVDNKDLEG